MYKKQQRQRAKSNNLNNKTGYENQLKDLNKNQIFKLTQQIIRILSNFSKKILSIQNNFDKYTNHQFMIKKTFNSYFKSLLTMKNRLNFTKFKINTKVIRNAS